MTNNTDPRLYIGKPGQRVPEWFQRVEWEGGQEPIVTFGGWVLIVRAHGTCFAKLICGDCFIRVDGNGSRVRLIGGDGDWAHFYADWRDFFSALCGQLDRRIK